MVGGTGARAGEQRRKGEGGDSIAPAQGPWAESDMVLAAALPALVLFLCACLVVRNKLKLQVMRATAGAQAGALTASALTALAPGGGHAAADDDAAAAFAQQYPGYGYAGKLEAMRADFAHLPRGEVYLDHAGATLCSASQVRGHADAILANTLGNPHSRNAAGQRTAQVVRRARELVLRHLQASEHDYAVVFTSGCTGAVQMLAQHFRWTPGKSVLGYSLCNHNSVLGMRQTAMQHSCPFVCVSPDVTADLLQRYGGAEAEVEEDDEISGTGGGDDEEESLDTPRTGGWESNKSDVDASSLDNHKAHHHDTPAHLFAFSAECNFSVYT